MTDAGNSDGTRFNRFNNLEAFLKGAVADGQLRRNPIDGTAPPKPEQVMALPIVGTRIRPARMSAAVTGWARARRHRSQATMSVPEFPHGRRLGA